ncbi:MAG: helix-turn-helix domain-containing protein [Solirubrobacterales bacterium]
MGEIGEALRERRMAMKIDVHEVEEETKIRAKYLRALENEEYNLLPGPAYVKSFLRTYADFLGLDSRSLVTVYKAEHERADEEHTIFAPRREADGSRFTGSRRWLLVVVAVIVIVLVLFLVGTIGGGSGGGS